MTHSPLIIRLAKAEAQARKIDAHTMAELLRDARLTLVSEQMKREQVAGDLLHWVEKSAELAAELAEQRAANAALVRRVLEACGVRL